MTKSLYAIRKSCDLAKAIKLTLVVVMSVITIARATVWFADAQSLPADAKATCVVTPTMFAGWFESGTVTANGIVKPADSITFPNVPNCSFYQWSEQMFLWLTSPVPSRYGGGSHVFDSPVFYDVSPPDACGKRTFIQHVPGKFDFTLRAAQVGPRGTPIVFDRAGKMHNLIRPQVGPNGRSLVRDKTGNSIEIERATVAPSGKPTFRDKSDKVIDAQLSRTGKGVLLDQAGKTITIARTAIGLNGRKLFLDLAGNAIDVEQGQAGGNEVLSTQGNSLIYYATQVNDVYAYFLTGTKNGGITPAPTHFPTNQAELTKITTFAGKQFPDNIALAIEVKSSWVETTGLANVSQYITMDATIPTYDKTNPDKWVQNGSKLAKLAMVGMHVVGSAKGHPEMIWATFEHFGNTPNATYSYTNSSNVTKTINQNTAGTWLFCASNGAAPFNHERMFFSSTPPPPNIQATNTNSILHIGPSNTLRLDAWGDVAGVGSASKNTEVIAINNSVLGMLLGGDVRKNYLFTGATWTIGGAPPSANNQVGTNMMANTTMETYVQAVTNCFSCHQGNMLGQLSNCSASGLSHIYGGLQPLP